MGYFPNGSAGMDYQEQYCSHCVNHADNNGSGSEGCFIFDLHLLWNYDACNGDEPGATPEAKIKRKALDHFIPRTNLGNSQCRMFVSRKPEDHVVDKTQALAEWEMIYGKRAE